MFTPTYRILLTKACFPPDNFICLGTQLISIIDVLKEFLPPHLWYGADVDAVGKNAMNLNNVQLNPIGVDKDFIQYCSGITQFIWGVFLCIDSTVSDQSIQKIEVETEDAAFRSIACEGVLLEIRTFDTSYFEIYSNQTELLDKIFRKFKHASLDFHTPTNNN